MSTYVHGSVVAAAATAAVYVERRKHTSTSSKELWKTWYWRLQRQAWQRQSLRARCGSPAFHLIKSDVNISYVRVYLGLLVCAFVSIAVLYYIILSLLFMLSSFWVSFLLYSYYYYYLVLPYEAIAASKQTRQSTSNKQRILLYAGNSNALCAHNGYVREKKNISTTHSIVSACQRPIVHDFFPCCRYWLSSICNRSGHGGSDEQNAVANIDGYLERRTKL